MKRLDELKVGDRARIVRIDSNGATAKRLMEMALLPGELIELVRIAPLGDPIAIQLDQTQISLRRKDAALILVEI